MTFDEMLQQVQAAASHDDWVLQDAKWALEEIAER